MRSTFLLSFLSLIILSGCSRDRLDVSGSLNPFAPLRLDEPLDAMTSYKLSRISEDGALCKAALPQAKMRWTPVPDLDTGTGCGYRDAIRVQATSLAVGEPFTLSCRSAVALAMWEYHVVLPAAQQHLGEPVTRLEHAGSYSCRNIAGRDAVRSQHASADALDVSGFVTKSGKRIRVARDWNSDSPGGRFLRDIRDGACRVFGTVLSPDYNAAHRDHLHLDRGGHHLCQ